MKKHHLYPAILVGFLLLMASGCASPIAENFRNEAIHAGSFPQVFENPGNFRGDTVIWGGSIVRTLTTREGSQIYILQSPLGSRDKPESADASEGRFIATTDRLLDPLVYASGRLITVAGQVVGEKVVVHKKSGNSYTYPVVSAGQLYLWPREEPALPPYWGPDYGPYWGNEPFWDYPYFSGPYGGEGWERDGDEGRDRDRDQDRR